MDPLEVGSHAFPYCVDVRRTLHANPRTRWTEDDTLTFIRHCVEEMQFDNLATPGITLEEGGLWFDLIADPQDRRSTLFRADVDGLPIEEKTGLPFAATNGTMHACGHDFHMAGLLGFMHAVARGLVTPKRNIRCVFDRAEENMASPPNPKTGARVLVERGQVLRDVEEVYGIHVNAELPIGVVFGRSGTFSGITDRMVVRIHTPGGHVMQPEQCVNSLDVWSALNAALLERGPSIFERGERFVIVPTGVNAGKGRESAGVIPQDLEAFWATRSFLPEDRRQTWQDLLHGIVAETVAKFPGATAEVEMVRGNACMFNTVWPRFAAILAKAGLICREMEPILGGESFAEFLLQRVGCFVFIGAGGPGYAGHHKDTFNPAEDVLRYQVATWTALARTPLQ